ncbi:hypothetical protein HOP52_14815 [Halomonas campisalis]|uniref:Carboxypeptidase regulatory-like domain-containing protein n=1 Tax=Billgrantia campisalis TaxID=74661 RepID=A0ABS9PB73_9GAMM|nr:hypothetical protein [Halomonas campisalis]MCG6659030.1 hypothetical protein [Halomonas campisalis]MDR5863751.1 hypothetical protein [Halomonas campisalis]
MKAWIPVALLGLALTGCQMMEPRPVLPPERIEVIDIGTQPAPEIERDAPTAPSPGRVARQVSFPEAEYAALPRTGNATVSGRLALNGVAAAGETVSVAPVTTYSAEAAENALAGRAVEPADPRAREYTHTTRTDGNGNFTLNGLPPGEFYVSGSMVDPASGQRQIIIRQVTLSNGRSLQVNLTR